MVEIDAVSKATESVPFAVRRLDRIPANRYYDPEFYRLESERLWPRVWQMACRLEEIPDPGDFVEYEILDQSVFVVRADASTVKAYHNTCPHRGMRLVQDRGNSHNGITCRFHGWSWDTSGRNTFMYQPGLFDAGNRKPKDLGLRDVRLELWGGAAFINFDDNAPPLRDSIEPFASYHDLRNAEKMRVDWWHSTILPTNWKLAMEAFMEGYHVMQTHPQLLPPGVTAKTAVYKPLRGGASGGSHSEMQRVAGSNDAVVDMMIKYMRILSSGMASMILEKDIKVAESLRGTDLPADPQLAAAEFRRKLNDALVKWNRDQGIPLHDLNALDAISPNTAVNFCFPNYFLLPIYGNMASYRIRPLGPEKCLFELWGLTLFPEGTQRPRLKTPEPMDCQDPRWPPIPLQDFSNLPLQQKGLHSRSFDYMRLSNEVEGMISGYQRLIDGYLAGLGYDKLLPAGQRVSGAIDAPLRDIGF